MRRDMQKSWRWFFIGRLAIMLAFTPEVRSAEVKVPYLNREPATAEAKRARLVTQVAIHREAGVNFAILPPQQGATMAMGGRF